MTDKRQQIMQAAEQLFQTQRFHEITTDDIARAAKVGKGTIYRYFKDKDDLFHQTATAGFEELCELLQTAMDDEPFERRLAGACRDICSFFDRRRQLFRMMQTEDMRMSALRGQPREQWVSRREMLGKAVCAILEGGADAGVVRTDIATDTLAQMLLGMLRARAHACCGGQDAIAVDDIVALFLHGAAAQIPAGQPTKSL